MKIHTMMNMQTIVKTPLTTLNTAALLAMAFIGSLSAQPSAEKEFSAYYLGNSLTRNIPLNRLAELFESAGYDYSYGSQLGGGHRLEQLLVMRNHGNKPGEGGYNDLSNGDFGTYDKAFKHHTWNAIVMQPYHDELDKEHQTMKHWPWHDSGVIQAADAFIAYARGETDTKGDRWDQRNPNTGHVAGDTFYIYATWPGADRALEEGGYSEQWDSDYTPIPDPKVPKAEHNAAYFAQLVEALNRRWPELPHKVRLIPSGHVMAALDKKIRAGELPGIEAFFERNMGYYRKARGEEAPFNPDSFQQDKGILNVYADGVHMNDQPHNGKTSGTIGSYITAVTIFTTLTGENPVGLTVQPYEMFDADKDKELIKAIQETVWEVVTGMPETGVK